MSPNLRVLKNWTHHSTLVLVSGAMVLLVSESLVLRNIVELLNIVNKIVCS